MAAQKEGLFYGWWVVIGSFLLLSCAYGTQLYAFPVFFDEMIRDMGWTRAQTAASLSISGLVFGVLSPIIGVLIHKARIRFVMIGGCILGGVGFYLLSTVTELWQFYIFYGLVLTTGIALIAVVPNMAIVQSWFVEKRSIALGVTSAGIGFGGVVMAPVARWLISMYGWQTSFLFLAAIIVLIGIPVSAIIMRTPEEKKLSPVKKQEGDNGGSVTGFALTQAMRKKAFWFISVAMMFWAWSYMIGLTHQVAFAVDIGLEKMAAAGAISLLTAFSIPGRLGFGKLGDIIDKRYVFMIGTSLQVVAFFVLLATTNMTMLYIYSFLLGLNIGGMSPILPGIIADYFGQKHFGAIYGFTIFATYIGMAIGPVYGGWIFDVTNSYFIAFLTSIVLSFIAIVLVYLAKKPAEEP